MVSSVIRAPAGRPAGPSILPERPFHASTSPTRMMGLLQKRSQLSQSTADRLGATASTASPALESSQVAPGSQDRPPSDDDSMFSWMLSPPKIVDSAIRRPS